MFEATAALQQACLQQLQTFNRTVGEACDEVVGKALEKPRAWRGYFAKGAGVVRRAAGWQESKANAAYCALPGTGPKFYALKDDNVAETEDSSLSWLTRWMAVKHYYFFEPMEPPTVTRDMKWEYFAERERVQRPDIGDWDDYSNVARNCIKKQGNQAIMYGRLPSCNWQPLTSFEHCWFNEERAMCESTLCNLFDDCYDGTNRSHAEAMSWKRLDILHSFWNYTDETTPWMTSGTSPISSSKQWEMRDGRLLSALVVTVLVIELVDKIVRRRRSGW